MNVDIQELEVADYNIMENVKTAIYRLWKYKLVVVLMTLVGCLAAIIYIGIVGVRTNYYSSASIYSMVYGSYEDSTNGVKVMNTYAGLLGSPSVCERAAALMQDSDISANTLKNMVSSGQIYLRGASTDSKSYGYELTLVTRVASPDNVVDISNAMAIAFVDEINELMGTRTLQVLDEATRYSMAKSISVPLYIAFFGALAMIGTCGIIFVKEFFSSKVFSVSQCESDNSLILGMIPYNK